MTEQREHLPELRLQIGQAITAWIEHHELQQWLAAEHLGLYQPEVHHLMCGHYGRVTAERLLSAWMRIGGEWTLNLDGTQLKDPDEAAQSPRGLEARRRPDRQSPTIPRHRGSGRYAKQR